MNIFDMVIEPSELASAIQSGLNSDLCIVDLSSEQAYLSGHIPGAVFLPFESLMCGIPPTPGKLPSCEQLSNIFSYLGLKESTHFIVADDEGGGWAGRFIWTLDVIGHKKFSYLNGGMHAWKNEGFALEKENNLRQKTHVNVSIHSSAIAEIGDILIGIENNNIDIWDARSASEFEGSYRTAAKTGHIPGAINCEWTKLMDHNNNLRIRSDAKTLLQQLGISGKKPIITHCQSHHRSGFTYLVGRSLNFDIQGYHGSWSEWGNHPDTPVEI